MGERSSVPGSTIRTDEYASLRQGNRKMHPPAAFLRNVGNPYWNASHMRYWRLLLVSLMFGSAAQAAPIAWRTTWDDSAFAQAAREHKYVLLDLHAVWCHWCHVMDEETYSDVRVQSLMDKHYVAISVD